MKKALLSACILTLLAAPVVILAQGTEGTDLSGTLGEKLDDVATTLQAIILVVAVIFIIIAAFFFITAAGDPDKVKTARNFVLYALVGVIVAVLARFLVTWAASFA